MTTINRLKNILQVPQGLSLLETLMAIMVLGAAVVSVGYFFSQGRANIDAFGRTRCALAVAQERMDALKDVPYLDSDLDEGIHSERVDASGDAAADGIFFREWTVSAVADDANGTDETMDYKLVDLSIYDQRLAPDSSTENDLNKLVIRLRTYISP